MLAEEGKSRIMSRCNLPVWSSTTTDDFEFLQLDREPRKAICRTEWLCRQVITAITPSPGKPERMRR